MLVWFALGKCKGFLLCSLTLELRHLDPVILNPHGSLIRMALRVSTRLLALGPGGVYPQDDSVSVSVETVFVVGDLLNEVLL